MSKDKETKDHRDDNNRREDADVIEITGEDAAFILGSGGRTKTKLAAVSGANLYIVEKQGRVVLEISGNPAAKARAKKYTQFVMTQRVKPVLLDPKDHPHDLTIVLVPYDAVSFVTGKGGRFLRMVEEEFGTLLFFLGSSGHATKGRSTTDSSTMQLAIFGDQRGRRGSELKIMTATEMKFPGHFTKDAKDFVSTSDGFDTDMCIITAEEYSYALGKGGSTRRKLSRASRCIVEYVGNVAYFAGTKKERECGREYLLWVLQQRVGPVNVDYHNRADCTCIMVPPPCIGYITGHRGISLRQMEEETRTFAFFEGAVSDDMEEPKPLLIFGTEDSRKAAEGITWEKIIQKSQFEQPGWEDRGPNGSRKSRKGDKKGKGAKGKGKGKDFGPGGKDDHSSHESTLVTDEGLPIGKTTLPISSEDAAFVMGPQGRTKRKVALASGTNVEIRSVSGADKVTIEGTEKRRKKAELYVNLVKAQRQGPVHLENESQVEDLTIVKVPGPAVSFVTGKQGSFLRLMEEEFGALLFFLDFNMDQRLDKTERLAILGPMRNRRGVELKVMAAVEMKVKGTYTTGVGVFEDTGTGFGTDTLLIAEEDYSYVLGRQGATRKNIIKTSGALVEYVGHVAFLCGEKAERQKAREYLLFLFDERKNTAEAFRNRGTYYEGKGTNGKGPEVNGKAHNGKGAPAAAKPADDEEPDDEWGDWGGQSDDDETEKATNGAARAYQKAVPFVTPEEELLDLPPQLLDEAAWPDLGGGGKKKRGR